MNECTRHDNCTMARALLRIGGTDEDFIACGFTPPTQEERKQAGAEGWPT